MLVNLALEHAVRAAAFLWLDEQSAPHGDELPYDLLRAGFEFEGRRIPLVVQQGIYKPKVLTAALTLRTAADSPYDDRFEDEDTLVYRYQGSDPGAWDNRAVREAFHHQLPLIYLHGIKSKPKPLYLVIRPVYVTADDPAELSFRLRAEADLALPTADPTNPLAGASQLTHLRRVYGTRLARTRIHQHTFRQRVLAAYRGQCAMCRLRHEKLLDAAHIIPDRDPRGEPLVPNGLSLCRIHHAAFDVHYLSIDPATYRIRVQPALLAEEDGPMLRHGLQELELAKLELPRRPKDHPDPECLRHHWEIFQAAS